MARMSKCNDCGFMVDNYSEDAEQVWRDHDCVNDSEVVELFESAINMDAVDALPDEQVKALLAIFEKAGY